MSLPEKGTYTITSTVDGAPVGRYISEDQSLLPKSLFVLPCGIQAPSFTIEQHNTSYSIMAAGPPTGVYNKYVFVFFGAEEPEDWIITPQPQSGSNIYTIETHKDGGWTVDENDEGIGGKQIAVAHLGSTFSDPPVYFDIGLWNITPIDRAD